MLAFCHIYLFRFVLGKLDCQAVQQKKMPRKYT